MRDEDIHIGDVLRIRQWSDMVDEYGTTDWDEDYYYCMIQVSPRIRFWRKMRYICGKTFTVSGIEEIQVESDKVQIYFSEEGVEKTDFATNRCQSWIVCAEMLEPIVENDDGSSNDEEIKASLNIPNSDVARECEIKCGDEVMVRQWDDMAREFGVDENGYIKTQQKFQRNWKRVCGERYVVMRITESRGVKLYYGWLKGNPMWFMSGFSADELVIVSKATH